MGQTCIVGRGKADERQKWISFQTQDGGKGRLGLHPLRAPLPNGLLEFPVAELKQPSFHLDMNPARLLRRGLINGVEFYRPAGAVEVDDDGTEGRVSMLESKTILLFEEPSDGSAERPGIPCMADEVDVTARQIQAERRRAHDACIERSEGVGQSQRLKDRRVGHTIVHRERL